MSKRLEFLNRISSFEFVCKARKRIFTPFNVPWKWI